MSFKVINKELKIYSCSIADVTLEQSKKNLESWNDGSTIETLTVFYDEEGNVFINADQKYFETFKEITVDYMMLPTDQKILLKDSMKAQSIIDILNVLDNAISFRKKEKISTIRKLLNYQLTSWDTFYTCVDIYDSFEEDGKILALADIYQYGFIQGKKAERAKKKSKNYSNDNTSNNKGDYEIMKNKNIIDLKNNGFKREVKNILNDEKIQTSSRSELFEKVKNVIYGICDVEVTNNHGVQIGVGTNLLYNEAKNEDVSICHIFDSDTLELNVNDKMTLIIDRNSPVLEAMAELFRQIELSE